MNILSINLDILKYFQIPDVIHHPLTLKQISTNLLINRLILCHYLLRTMDKTLICKLYFPENSGFAINI